MLDVEWIKKNLIDDDENKRFISMCLYYSLAIEGDSISTVQKLEAKVVGNWFLTAMWHQRGTKQIHALSEWANY